MTSQPDTRDPRYAAVPRLGGGWGVIDYREGRYLEMTERSDEPQRQTAERLAGEANARPAPDLAAVARLFVKDVEDYYDDDVDYVARLSYRQLKAALADDQSAEAGGEGHPYAGHTAIEESDGRG